jgi:hypothetical protein
MAPKNPGKRARNTSPASSADELADQLADQRRKVRELKRLREQEQELLEGGETVIEADAPTVPGSNKIEEILSKLQGDGTFEVFRLTGGGQSKLGTYDLVAWPEAQEALVRQHGGGEYLTVFRHADGSYAGRVTRTYDPSSYKGTPQAQNGSADAAAFLKILQDANAEHSRQMEAMRLEMSKLQSDQTKMILEMVKSQSASPFKNVQEIAMLGKLFKGDNDEIDRLLKLRDLMEDLKGEPEPAAVHTDNPIVALISQFTGALARAQVSPRPASLPNPSPEPTRPTPAPTQGKISAPVPELKSEPATVPADPLDLTVYIPQFTAAIQAGRSPIEAAKDVWETAEKGGYTAGIEMIAEDGRWGALEADPFLKQHGKWLLDFRESLKGFSHVPD